VVVCAKMAEPTEMSFEFRTQVDTGNHVLDGRPDTPLVGAILGTEEPIVSIGTFCCELCKNS